MRIRSSLLLLLACGGASVTATEPAAAEGEPAPAPTAAISCDTLRPCRPDLGVCLRCTTPDNPEWVWSEAPGSPHLLALLPGSVSMPHPDLKQSCCWPAPFDHHIPDCRRVVFDERGMPLETRTLPGEVEDLHRFIYEDGRLVRREQDEVPFCVFNDFGDRRPCGESDGTFHTAATYTWSDDGRRVTTANGLEWVFDDGGRLLRWQGHDDSGRNVFRDGRVVERVRAHGSTETAARLYYEDGRLVRLERSFEGQSEVLRWSYDPHGWPIRRELPTGVTLYDNEYTDGRLVRRTIAPIESPMQSGDRTTLVRTHDEHGLVIEERREPNGRVGPLTVRWERNERGVPTTYVRHDVRVDQRCLEPLARHFVR